MPNLQNRGDKPLNWRSEIHERHMQSPRYFSTFMMKPMARINNKLTFGEKEKEKY